MNYSERDTEIDKLRALAETVEEVLGKGFILQQNIEDAYEDLQRFYAQRMEGKE
jgi:hypothetical protein